MSIYLRIGSKYCPEAWLSRWLNDSIGYHDRIWLLEKTGVVPLREAYSYLVKHLSIDAIVLVDGGIDAVLRGDETSIGTPVEDLSSLAAVIDIPLSVKILACLGMGTERRDGICHAQFLNRVADLSKIGGYLGVATLCHKSRYGDAYEKVVEYILENQVGLRFSHVQKTVLAACRGEFGAVGPEVWINPLMSMYWFFDAHSVASTHAFLPLIMNTHTALEVGSIIESVRRNQPQKAKSEIPL